MAKVYIKKILLKIGSSIKRIFTNKWSLIILLTAFFLIFSSYLIDKGILKVSLPNIYNKISLHVAAFLTVINSVFIIIDGVIKNIKEKRKIKNFKSNLNSTLNELINKGKRILEKQNKYKIKEEWVKDLRGSVAILKDNLPNSDTLILDVEIFTIIKRVELAIEKYQIEKILEELLKHARIIIHDGDNKTNLEGFINEIEKIKNRLNSK